MIYEFLFAALLLGQNPADQPAVPPGMNFGVDLSHHGTAPGTERYTVVGGREAVSFLQAVRVGSGPPPLARVQPYSEVARLAAELDRARPADPCGFLRGRVPGVSSCQYRGTDAAILDAACTSGRLPVVSLSDLNAPDQPARYGVLIHLGEEQAAVRLDGRTIWMTRRQFLRRWAGPEGAGRAVILISSPKGNVK